MITQLLKLIWVWFFGRPETKEVGQVELEPTDLKPPTFSKDGGFVSSDKQDVPDDEHSDHQEVVEKDTNTPTTDDEWKKWQDKFHGQG